MSMGRPGSACRYGQTLFNLGSVGGMTDGELLGRFASGGGEAAELAFAALVERHGPMVLRVCRSVLSDEHDAQDALQATFLVLVRRARSIRNQDSVASWLHGVARRVAPGGSSLVQQVVSSAWQRVGDWELGRRFALGMNDEGLRPIHLEGLYYEQAKAGEARAAMEWAEAQADPLIRTRAARHRPRDPRAEEMGNPGGTHSIPDVMIRAIAAPRRAGAAPWRPSRVTVG